MYSFSPKAALVWPPGGEGSHNKGAGVAGGVGGSSPPTSQQAAPQGLVHWMSVMAEHMNNPHHDAVHYMWNGVEVSTQHSLFFLLIFIYKSDKKINKKDKKSSVVYLLKYTTQPAFQPVFRICRYRVHE